MERHQERQKFYEQHLGQSQTIHSLLSEPIHVHVHMFEPRPTTPLSIWITNGLSENLMDAPTPAGLSVNERRIELLLYTDATKESEFGRAWPLNVLRNVAKVPLDRKTWFNTYLAAPLSKPPAPIVPGSSLTIPFFLPPLYENEAFQAGLTCNDGERVSFLWLDFITTAEFEFLLRNGLQALLSLFNEMGHGPPLNPLRASFV